MPNLHWTPKTFQALWLSVSTAIKSFDGYCSLNVFGRNGGRVLWVFCVFDSIIRWRGGLWWMENRRSFTNIGWMLFLNQLIQGISSIYKSTNYVEIKRLSYPIIIGINGQFVEILRTRHTCRILKFPHIKALTQSQKLHKRFRNKKKNRAKFFKSDNLLHQYVQNKVNWILM